jgi:hypothetical protein
VNSHLEFAVRINLHPGVRREEDPKSPLVLQDHGRFPELMAAATSDARKTFMRNTQGPTRPVRRTPALVSFVGQTGAGKSTLIRLLVGLKHVELTSPGRKRPQLPVVGNAGGDIPTSDDVHLYIDPSTEQSDSPILYADCEGLDGGERQPLAATFRARAGSEDPEPRYASEGSFRAAFCSERDLTWSDESSMRTRDFVVSQLYSRLLFSFSDVVVFIQRNAR